MGEQWVSCERMSDISGLLAEMNARDSKISSDDAQRSEWFGVAKLMVLGL